MKRIIAVVLLGTAGIVLIVPVYLLLAMPRPGSAAETAFFIHRILGLYAFSLIFLQIVIGSGKFLLYKIFPAGLVLKTHMLVGKIAFVLALLHPVLLYSTYLWTHTLVYPDSYGGGSNSVFYAMGVIALTILTVSVGAAILRRFVGSKWIYLHRLNYLIFWIVFIHSINLGVDVKSPMAHAVYYIYGGIVALLTVRRVTSLK